MRSRIISAEVGAATDFGATGTPVGEALGGAVVVCASAKTNPNNANAAQAKNLLTFSGIFWSPCNSY
jgi:hypothetical protein